MVRDFAFFHLPLRQVVADLVHAGALPEWNRFVHGGQPILSNPNYAAFYPPSWLALALPVPYALAWLVILHAAWALAGAWLLLRRLGAGRDAAALGAMGFAASSWFLSLTSTFNFYCAMAWFPWVLAAGEAALATPRAGRWGGKALLAALGLALQLLAGEPVAVLISGLALAALALGPFARLRRSLARLLAIGVLAAAIAAVQLAPTLHRLGGTARGTGLRAAEADLWSSPPARFVDFVLPRFWGDPMRDEEGLWLGWGLHDRDFPYVVALYSGLLLTVLAVAALLRWPIPYRASWGVAAVLGSLLALGRHDPLWEPLRHVPLLSVVRYPEKFLVLTAAVVPLAGALGWHHLLGSRERGERERAYLPAALAAIVTAVATLFAVLLAARPAVGEGFIRGHSGLPPSPRALAIALAFLRREALVALLLAAGATLLLVLLGGTRLSRRGAAVAALALLAMDLWWYGRGLEPTLPATEVLTPPPAVAPARAEGGRLFSSADLDRRPEIGLRRGPRGFQQLWERIQRLDPYVANLWGLEYALHHDYDLMLTSWARHSLAQLEAAWPNRDAVDRLLGAWDVSTLVLRRDPRQLVRELRLTRKPPQPYQLLPEPRRLPRFRFVGSVTGVATAAEATAALPTLDLATADLCVGAAAPAAAYAPAHVLAARQRQEVRLRYRATGPAFLVAALTFDEGWEARLEDGTPVPTCPTSLGQVGVALPAGEHTLRLAYHDPWVRLGAAGTGLTLLGAALVALRRRPAGPTHGAPSSTVESPA